MFHPQLEPLEIAFQIPMKWNNLLRIRHIGTHAVLRRKGMESGSWSCSRNRFRPFIGIGGTRYIWSNRLTTQESVMCFQSANRERLWSTYNTKKLLKLNLLVIFYSYTLFKSICEYYSLVCIKMNWYLIVLLLSSQKIQSLRNPIFQNF